MPLVLYIDGGARGNPGPAAAGVVLRDSSKRSLFEAGYLLGLMTNNQAEYSALLLGLQTASRYDTDRLTIYSDSELMVRQITGEYRVKAAGLKPLFKDVQRELLKFNSWEIRHLGREQNRRADQLLNQALDREEDVVAVQTGEIYPRLSPRQAGTSGKSSPSASSLQSSSIQVLAEVDIGSAAQTCQAPCEAGAKYVFGDTVPDGLCIDAADALLGKVLELKRESSLAKETAGPVTVKCNRPGCGAVFRVSISQSNGEKDAGNPA